MEFNKQNLFNKVKEATRTTVVMDEGLRAYMLKVYNYMATGILLTGIIALFSFKMSVVTDASGAIAGFTSFCVHAGGTPTSIYLLPLRLKKEIYVGTRIIFFTFVNLIKLPLYIYLSMVNLKTFSQSLIVAPAGASIKTLIVGLFLPRNKSIPHRIHP